MKKKAQVTQYIVWFILAILIITITAVLAPMGVLFNTKMYTEGESILNRALPDINAISDSSVRTSVNDTVQAALAAGENNIEVNSNLFQYSWIFVLVLTAIFIFMQTRILVEFRTGGGGLA